MADPLNELKAGFARVRGSEEFSDCKVICGPYHFNAHKVILSTQSGYFKTAFKTGAFKEGETGIIHLAAKQGKGDEYSDVDDACDEPEIVKCMMDYFYRFIYTVKEGFTGPQPIIVHAKVFAISIKYQANGLRDLATTKFGEAVKSSWNTRAFAQAIEIVYNSTTDDNKQLRNIVADTIHEHFDDLKYGNDVEAVVSQIPGLAYGLLKRSRKSQTRLTCKHHLHHEPNIPVMEVTCDLCKVKIPMCSNCLVASRGVCPNCCHQLWT